jgi:hypothetical protein
MTITQNILHNEKDPKFQIWLQILKHSPTNLWEQPVLTFIRILLKTKSKLSKKDKAQCVYFMHNLAIYIYAKRLGGNLIKGQSVEKEMEKAITIAKEGKMYEPDIKITKQFKQKLNGDIPKELRWGLCAIVEFAHNYDIFMHHLNEIDKIYLPKLKAKTVMLKNAVVEQLIPDDWIPDPVEQTYCEKPCDRWNRQKVKKAINSIGGLFLIEKSIHQHTSKITKDNFYANLVGVEDAETKTYKIAKNNFLADRKKIKNGYKNSIFGEVMHLCIEYTPLWNEIPLCYFTYKNRQTRGVKSLIEFFTNCDGVVVH